MTCRPGFRQELRPPLALLRLPLLVAHLETEPVHRHLREETEVSRVTQVALCQFGHLRQKLSA